MKYIIDQLNPDIPSFAFEFGKSGPSNNGLVNLGWKALHKVFPNHTRDPDDPVFKMENQVIVYAPVRSEDFESDPVFQNILQSMNALHRDESFRSKLDELRLEYLIVDLSPGEVSDGRMTATFAYPNHFSREETVEQVRKMFSQRRNSVLNRKLDKEIKEQPKDWGEIENQRDFWDEVSSGLELLEDGIGGIDIGGKLWVVLQISLRSLSAERIDPVILRILEERDEFLSHAFDEADENNFAYDYFKDENDEWDWPRKLY